MNDNEREAKQIAISVKCGVLPLLDALEMAKQCNCLYELQHELNLPVTGAEGDDA